MCGRASLSTPDWETIRAILDAVPDEAEAAAYKPRYNVAPTQPHPILRVVDGERRLARATWGMGLVDGRQIINARAETIAHKAMWQEPLAERRCIVPVDGFFEWQENQPYWFHRADGGLLLLAGLWENAGPQPRFIVVTCAPNQLVAAAHDRMPAILPPECVAEWLQRPAVDVIAPAPESLLVATPVSTKVNSPANDDPSLLQPVRPQTQLRLF